MTLASPPLKERGFAAFINNVKTGETDYVIIFLGSNDYWKKDISDISNIIRFVDNRNCLWVGPPKMYGKSHTFNIRLKEYIESNSNCKYFDSESIDLELADEVHPTLNGARYWWISIIKYLAEHSF